MQPRKDKNPTQERHREVPFADLTTERRKGAENIKCSIISVLSAPSREASEWP